MDWSDMRNTLPLHIDRPFRPWGYEFSHRRLTLRSKSNIESGETLYVVFLDVLGMKIRHSYVTLDICESETTDRAEIDQFVEIPERHSGKYLRLVVGDDLHKGFVVCGALDIRTEPPSM